MLLIYPQFLHSWGNPPGNVAGILYGSNKQDILTSMDKVRVSINGFGRIGRAFFRHALEREDLEVVAINDLADLENLAYLLKYDTAYGHGPADVRVERRDWKTVLVVNGRDIQFTQERDPAKLPWSEYSVDVVVEATGFFTEYGKASAHLEAGAKRVVISAPAKGEPVEGIVSGTVLMGINDDILSTCQITSNASCTTNASSPLIQILHEHIGIEKAFLNTVHGYTSTQKLVDSPDSKDFRRGRAAAQNIVPSTTGAARAVTKVVTDLEGLFDGMAMRVPVITGSAANIVFIAKRDTSVAEVNDTLKWAAGEERWQETFTVTEDPIVSSDIVGSKYAAIADLGFTRVIGGNLVSVLSWYDNEMGYSHALAVHVAKLGKHAQQEKK